MTDDTAPVRERQSFDEPPSGDRTGVDGLADHQNVLAAAHQTFRHWFGADYDLQVLDAVLATGAVEQLDGDPVWLLVISGSGDSKTETVGSLAGVGAIVTSTITSEGALMSATKADDGAPWGKPTGGLLGRLDALPRKLLVLKDFTTILSADRNVRNMVLAALREIYDGRWERNVGVSGGQSRAWVGRIAVIGACTTAWDTHHSVMAMMGNRFVLVRGNSNEGRSAKGMQAIRNVGHEGEMRQQLHTAVRSVLEAAKRQSPSPLTDAEQARLMAAADLVTRLRSPVDFDYKGNVEHVHALEAPTRFAKQLAQIMRGALVIGLDRDGALALALRCARDTVPPMRLAVLADVAEHGRSRCSDVMRRLQKPRFLVKKELQALHALGLLTAFEDKYDQESYDLAEAVDLAVLAVAGKSE